MDAGIFSRLRQQTSGHHPLVTNGNSAVFRFDKHRTCVWHCTLSLPQAIIHWQDRQWSFTIATLQPYVAVSHTRKHETGHTHSVTSCDDDRHVWLQQSSPCNFSALCYLLRLLHFLLTMSWLDIHSTLTVYRLTNDFLDQLRQCQQRQATLSQMNFALQLQLILSWFHVSKTTGIRSDDHCHSFCLTSYSFRYSLLYSRCPSLTRY